MTEQNPEPATYDSQQALLASLRRQTERRIAELPPAWQTRIQAEWLRRENKGRKPGTNRSWAQAWATLARTIGNRDPATVSADEWEVIIHGWLKDHKRASVSVRCVNIKQTLPRFFPDKRLPEDVAKALIVPAGRRCLSPDRELSKDDFLLLLDHVTTEEAKRDSARVTAEKVALLWTLWDSWMRVNEMLACQRSDRVRAGPKTTFGLRPEMPFLKTNDAVRQVPMVEATEPLAVWDAMHPAGSNLDAPIFCNFRCKTGLSRLSDSNLDRWLKQVGDGSGLHKRRKKKLSAHDFRHTGNTRSARNKWARTLRAKKAGWSKTSRMPEHYEHLDEADMHRQLLQDAGIDLMGFKQQMDAGNLEGALADLLTKLLEKRRNEPAPIVASGPVRI
ncbi:MAG: hypothetical protein QOD77_1617 [Thermoplasmata archaeon]|nr:hypothetical protein [Thermoplasmata archaeon]